MASRTLATLILLAIVPAFSLGQTASPKAEPKSTGSDSPVAEKNPFLLANLPGLAVPFSLGQKEGDPKDKDKEKDKKDPKKDPQPAPPEQDVRPVQTAFEPIDHKPMFTDYNGLRTLRTFRVVYTLSTQRADVAAINGQVEESFRVLVPVLTRGPFKIADNASPRPFDRVYVTYNYYYHMPVQVLSSTGLFTLTTPFGPVGNRPGAGPIPGQFTLRENLNATLLNNPQSPPSRLTSTNFTFADVQRQNFGIEKTFLDGRGSFEARIPLIQVQQGFSATLDNSRVQNFGFPGSTTTGALTEVSNGLGNSFLGDVTLAGKFALYDDRETGNFLSAGLAVTLPTGQATTVSGGQPGFVPSPLIFPGAAGPAVQVFPQDQTIRSTLFQPFVGYIVGADRWYLHGFSSVVVPTESRDAMLWFNDLGVAYKLYENRERFISSITPTVEGHVATRLNNIRPEDGASALDSVAINAGVHIGLGSRSILSLGVSIPVTGPRPYQAEGIAMFNFFY